jgi:hypothetical protein
MEPFGLTHQVRLNPEYTTPIPGIVYDPSRQLSTVGGRPLSEQPELIRQYTVTWGTTGNDNKTDDGG